MIHFYLPSDIFSNLFCQLMSRFIGHHDERGKENTIEELHIMCLIASSLRTEKIETTVDLINLLILFQYIGELNGTTKQSNLSTYTQMIY